MGMTVLKEWKTRLKGRVRKVRLSSTSLYALFVTKVKAKTRLALRKFAYKKTKAQSLKGDRFFKKICKLYLNMPPFFNKGCKKILVPENI
jgi:hypothetical protein